MPMKLRRSLGLHPWHPVCTARSCESHDGLPVAHMLAVPLQGAEPRRGFVARRLVLPDGLLERAAHRGEPAAIWIPGGVARARGFAWTQVLAAAEQRPVLLSLDSFAACVNAERPDTVRVRLLRESGKPTCARVVYANRVTAGFALQDVLPFGWAAPGSRRAAVRCLQKTRMLEAFCRRHGLVTLLATEADTDAATGHPICLFREARRGLLLVIDLDPPAALPGGAPIAPYGGRLFAQALGWMAPNRGQYAVAPRSRQEFQQVLSQLCERFPALRWVPAGASRGAPLGWVSRRSPFAVPSAHAIPAVLLRTGFAPHEWDLVYGVLAFLKQSLLFGGNGGHPLDRMRVGWVPVSCAEAVPPATRTEYRYLMAVPPVRRRRPPEPVPAADVRIDLARGRSGAIVIRTDGPVGPAFRRTLDRLAPSLGVAVRLQVRLGTNGRRPRAWRVAFPLESDHHRYDAITATDRVVRLLEAILLEVC